MLENITGKKYSRLTAVGLDKTTNKKSYWIFLCDCGNFKSIKVDSVKSGKTRSCGCLKKEQEKINLTKYHSHLKSGTNLYYKWQGIKARCYNKNDVRYHNYGGRGIKVCDEWKNSFIAFYDWVINNGYKEGLTIDRIDVNGDYEPNNCKWSTWKEQANNRTTNINITIGNETKNLMQWCEIFKLKYKTVYTRFKRNKEIKLFDLFAPTNEYEGIAKDILK